VASNVGDATFEILKGIQASIATLNERVGEFGERFDRLEAEMRKDRRNVAGMLVMMRATAGDFDARVAEVHGARSPRAVGLDRHLTSSS
jgi:hypothetical protein